MLRVRSYAKINWFLEVRDRRTDGYTNIETIFQSIDLFDVLQLEAAQDDLTLTCSNEALPCDAANLAMRAAQRLREASGYPGGARLHLEKRIPIAAGLAGGSGNAAAALLGLARLWQLDWSLSNLQALGAQLGADVPFCMQGGAAIGIERGDILTPLPPIVDRWLVLLHPPIEVSTAWVYRHPDLGRAPGRGSEAPSPAFEAACRAIRSGDTGPAVYNRMQDLVFAAHPSLAEAYHRLLQAGCEAAAMSGSGPTLFGLCATEAEAHRIADACSDFRTSVAKTVDRGVQFEDHARV